MATRITISIADTVFEDIEHSKPKDIGRSEYVEELIRIGLQKKAGDKHEDKTRKAK